MGRLVNCPFCGGNGCFRCHGEGEVTTGMAHLMECKDQEQEELDAVGGEQPHLDPVTRKMVWPSGWLQRVIEDEKAKIAQRAKE